MSKIILINGKKRSGKDYTAQMMKQYFEDSGFTVAVMSFADPIKEIIACTFNMSLELLDVLKNQKNAIYIEKQDATEDEYYLSDALVKVSDFRTILQRFGTEAMQSMFGKTVWVDLLLKNANNSGCDIVLVPDFRFKAENIGNVSIKIRNDDVQDSCDTHASENELNDFEFDYEIDNTRQPDITESIQSLCNLILIKEFNFFIP